MGFGNPYGDTWSLDIIHEWVGKLIQKGVKTIPLSDITGESTPDKIKMVYSSLISKYPQIEFGFHLHARPDDWFEKVEAAYNAGCRRFDSVLGGLGGCPMTGYELLSNLNTQHLIVYLNKQHVNIRIDSSAFNAAFKIVSNF